jgi:hypothetical protein
MPLTRLAAYFGRAFLPIGCCQTNANQSPFAQPTRASGGKKAAPLGESGGTGLLEVAAVKEVALRRKVVVD